MKNKNNKATRCVFVDLQFAEMFPNFNRYYREAYKNLIFDCVSVSDKGNYLDIAAIHQKTPDILKNLHIWIPTQFVRSVLFDSEDRLEMGFVQTQQGGNDQNQGVRSP